MQNEFKANLLPSFFLCRYANKKTTYKKSILEINNPTKFNKRIASEEQG